MLRFKQTFVFIFLYLWICPKYSKKDSSPKLNLDKINEEMFYFFNRRKKLWVWSLESCDQKERLVNFFQYHCVLEVCHFLELVNKKEQHDMRDCFWCHHSKSHCDMRLEACEHKITKGLRNGTSNDCSTLVYKLNGIFCEENLKHLCAAN